MTRCCGVTLVKEIERHYWNIHLQIKNNKLPAESERERKIVLPNLRAGPVLDLWTDCYSIKIQSDNLSDVSISDVSCCSCRGESFPGCVLVCFEGGKKKCCATTVELAFLSRPALLSGAFSFKKVSYYCIFKMFYGSY